MDRKNLTNFLVIICLPLFLSLYFIVSCAPVDDSSTAERFEDTQDAATPAYGMCSTEEEEEAGNVVYISVYSRVHVTTSTVSGCVRKCPKRLKCIFWKDLDGNTHLYDWWGGDATFYMTNKNLSSEAEVGPPSIN